MQVYFYGKIAMTLGPVYISGLFLQQFVDSLYKAELMPCRYST